ncbi:MAG: putative metal-binding motif-containing protein, partial [Deltaproteobacteria bacterium]|nr:putative metal-binding motif-containing protein [Deltaproteobacteria bacterium]
MPRPTPLFLFLALGVGCNDEDTCPEDTAGCPEDTAPDWVDADGDGVIAGVDCDDANAAVYPGAADVCDGVDNDCDGETDEDGLGGSVFYADADADSYGDPTTAGLYCEAPEGWVENGEDCDDSDGSVYPGADEFCDG